MKVYRIIVAITHNLALTSLGDKDIYMKNGEVE